MSFKCSEEQSRILESRENCRPPEADMNPTSNKKSPVFTEL